MLINFSSYQRGILAAFVHWRWVLSVQSTKAPLARFWFVCFRGYPFCWSWTVLPFFAEGSKTTHSSVFICMLAPRTHNRCHFVGFGHQIDRKNLNVVGRRDHVGSRWCSTRIKLALSRTLRNLICYFDVLVVTLSTSASNVFLVKKFCLLLWSSPEVLNSPNFRNNIRWGT